MVSERIKAIRKTLQLSQAEFGRELGVSRDVIGNIEYERVEPKHVFLEHLCRVFNINYDWLYSGSGDMFKKDIASNKELEEAIELFSKLNPNLQKYALQQIKGLVEVQNSNSKDSHYN